MYTSKYNYGDGKTAIDIIGTENEAPAAYFVNKELRRLKHELWRIRDRITQLRVKGLSAEPEESDEGADILTTLWYGDEETFSEHCADDAEHQIAHIGWAIGDIENDIKWFLENGVKVTGYRLDRKVDLVEYFDECVIPKKSNATLRREQKAEEEAQ